LNEATHSGQYARYLSIAGIALLAATMLIFGCAKEEPDAAHHIDLGEWTAGSLTFAAFLATDSAPFADSEPPLVTQPVYRADTVYYGLIQSYVGDPHGSRHIVRDRDDRGQDVFYFDANNNEDLTDDGPPMTWKSDPADSTEWIDLTYALPDGPTWSIQFIAGGYPDRQTSEAIGRPVLVYAVRSNTSRFGTWVVRNDSLPVEFYAFQPPGPDGDSLGNWFILIDVNRDGVFDPQPPDLLIPSAEPTFEFDSLRWQVTIDPGVGGITLTSAIPEPLPTADIDVAAAVETAVTDTMPYRKYMTPLGIKLRAPSFAGYDMNGDYISLDSLRGRLLVLNFWTGSCVPCRTEIPRLNQLKEKLEGQAEFISLIPESREAVERLLAAIDFRYRTVPDAGQAFQDYGVTGYPVHVLIDRNGYVRFSRFGAAEDIDVQIEGWIRAMLARRG